VSAKLSKDYDENWQLRKGLSTYNHERTEVHGEIKGLVFPAVVQENDISCDGRLCRFCRSGSKSIESVFESVSDCFNIFDSTSSQTYTLAPMKDP
jgi:hypothetical protein